MTGTQVHIIPVRLGYGFAGAGRPARLAVSGVPTSFHLGPLTFTSTASASRSPPTSVTSTPDGGSGATASTSLPSSRFVVVVLLGGLVGARAANIATNWCFYSGHPGRWMAVWQGGLASFGGIALAILLGLYLQRRWWPDVSLLAFCDALVPALVAGWALGRVLGPQFMVNGGGHLTHQWFGMHYAGQVGRRVPVPLIQGAEDALLWGLLVAGRATRPRRASSGVLTGVAMFVWGLVRTLDERLLLGQESHSGSLGVQVAGLALGVAGAAVLVVVGLRGRRGAGQATAGGAVATAVTDHGRDDDRQGGQE